MIFIEFLIRMLTKGSYVTQCYEQMHHLYIRKTCLGSSILILSFNIYIVLDNFLRVVCFSFRRNSCNFMFFYIEIMRKLIICHIRIYKKKFCFFHDALQKKQYFFFSFSNILKKHKITPFVLIKKIFCIFKRKKKTREKNVFFEVSLM